MASNPSAASAAALEASGNASAHARVQENAHAQKTAEAALDNYADVLIDVQQQNQTQWDIPNSGFLVGKYLPTDRDADRYWQSYFGMSTDPNGPVGTKMFDFNEWYQYNEEKYKTEQYRDLLNLGSLMIDPKDPGSRERAFAVMPELHAVPAKRAMKLAALQMKLHYLLVQGEVTSRQDLEFLYQLLRKDSVIPLTPIWADMLMTDQNLKGVLGSAIMGGPAAVPNSMQFNSGWYSFFNPYTYKVGAGAGAGNTDPQYQLKVVIARRLLPGLRNADPAQMDAFLQTLGDRRNGAGALEPYNVMEKDWQIASRAGNAPPSTGAPKAGAYYGNPPAGAPGTALRRP